MKIIYNHYGYGLRNDEAPYAHKIPAGGNWKSLSDDEQKEFMKRAFYSEGGEHHTSNVCSGISLRTRSQLRSWVRRRANFTQDY